MKFLILCSLFLIGCGTFHPGHYQDPRLMPYIKAFEDTYGIKLDYTVKFGDIKNYAGICSIKHYSNGYIRKTVTISKDFKFKDNYYAMHQLLFHEFGHCSFYLNHNENIYKGREVSIMYPNAFGHYSYYKQNLKYYLEQLWTSYISYATTSINWKTSHQNCHFY